MIEWTEERIRRFWKKSGFSFVPASKSGKENICGKKLAMWQYPDGSQLTFLPLITNLNALFEWAVPILTSCVIDIDSVVVRVKARLVDKASETEYQHYNHCTIEEATAIALAEAMEKVLKI